MAKELAQSLSGTVCVNESLLRRIPRDARMVYIDWDNGDYVSFILGSVSMQVSAQDFEGINRRLLSTNSQHVPLLQLPRYLTFDSSSTKKVKPFYTEFCVYQSANVEESNGDEKGSDDDVPLRELCCSKIARVYNFEGKLKQGCTSFYTLKRL